MKKNKLLYILLLCMGLCTSSLFMSCDDEGEVANPEYDRLFSPVNLVGEISNKTNVTVSWAASVGADSYILEVIKGVDDTGEKVVSETLTYDQTSYLVSGLEGETEYTIRVKAVSSESKKESKWKSIVIETAAEQIFYTIAKEDLGATEVTLRWPAGQVATELIVTPGDIVHSPITADEIAAGAVTITGLTGATKYTAKLMNGEKTRGTITFETMIDLGGATPINDGDDLVAILDAANDGDSFVIMSGAFNIGDYVLTKSISLSGYEVDEKPTIKGYFNLNGTVGSLMLKNLILDGTESRSYPVNGSSGAVGGNVSIVSCEINNYKAGVASNNSGAVSYGNILVSDCIVNNNRADGGDGFDFRAGGTLTSLTVENSTFNTGFRAFLRMQITSNVIFRNCTFYKISTVDNSNNTGIFRITGGTLQVSKCLLVETGPSGATIANGSSGNWCRRADHMGAAPTYTSNYYYNCYNLWVGLYTNPSQCDATEADPGFADAANGDFTISNNTMINNVIGDPRWIK